MPEKYLRHICVFMICALLCTLGAAFGEGTRVYAYAYTLKVYEDPSKKSDVVAQVPFARELTLLAAKNGWAKVVGPNGKTGYCYAKQLTKRNPNRYDTTVYSQQDRAPVYERPSVDAPMIGHLNRNQKAKMIAMTPSGDWLRVQYGSRDGYIQRPRVDYKKFSKGRRAWVSADSTEVRYDPGIDSSFCKLSKGQAVQVLSTHDGWAKLRSSKGLIGYCRADALTSKKPK